MKRVVEDQIRPSVEKFVKDLAGYYENHCSDELLVTLLMWELDTPRSRNSLTSYADCIVSNLVDDAYHPACIVFEHLLEACGAGGNGHHMAQNFVAFLKGQLGGGKNA